MEVLQRILEWLNDPSIKTVLALVGGFALKRWSPVLNKAIPAVLLACSAVIAALRAAFPGFDLPDATPSLFQQAEYAAAGLFGGGGFGHWLSSTVLPIAYAIAIHSGSKNTRQWAQVGWQLTQR